MSFSKSNSVEKDIATTANPPTRPLSNYWTATIVNGIVTPIKPLTYHEARCWAASERDLLCIDHGAALAIVKFCPTAIWDHAHGSKEDGYLNHYHLSNAHKSHIWYYGE